MAYTKVKPIRNTLRQCLEYTMNPEKTVNDPAMQTVLNYTQDECKTAHCVFVTGINCVPDIASEMMERTRVKWKKSGQGHVLGYHMIQSFEPGEIAPEKAHEIGCEFVRRSLGDRYEATVSTHLDKKHIHNHIVWNSVSFVDGKMYRDDFHGYYENIRGKSDELCRENGISVIVPKHKGKAYGEWAAEKQGKPTARGLVRVDVDRVLESAVSWQTFVLGMERMGYTVRWGERVKYATVKHRTSKRAIRLKSLGEGYSEQEIRNRIENNRKNPRYREEEHLPCIRHRRSRFHGAFPLLPHQKITGFMALYYHYLYLFRKARGKSHSAKRTQFLLREDMMKFDRYVKQAQYLWDHRIETDAQLEQVRNRAESNMKALEQRRNELRRKRGVKSVDQEALKHEIAELTEQMRGYRREAVLCESIRQDAERLRHKITEVQRQEYEVKQKEKRKEKRHEQRR